MSIRNFITVLFFISTFSACKKGFEGTSNIPSMPETFMAIDKIERSGENRLTTLVEAHWWGVSSGGFIKGYEISTDNQLTWHFTTRQDSSFLLKIPPGKDSADIAIYVRAIDHLGQTDPSPASTLYPIKNSKPQVKFIFSTPIAGIPSQNPVNIFPVLKYTIFGEDPDGADDIFQYELYVNDTNRAPYLLPANTSSFMLVANTPKADSSDCKIFINGSNNPLNLAVKGLLLQAKNTLYIRAIDKALSASAFIPTPSVWIKKVSSDILMVNAYTSNKIFVQNYYANNLSKIGISSFDTLQATEVIDNNYTQLQPDFQAQNKAFGFFKKIVWFGDDANFSFSYGQRTTTDFFNNGGQLFMSVAINSNFDPLSNFLDWTPIKSLVNPPPASVFRVNINALVQPVINTWPTIKSTAIIPSARPFEILENTTAIGYDSLYFGGIIESKSGQPPVSWTGKSAVIAKRYAIGSNQTNFIISSLPLERFNGNNNIDTVFIKIFKEELKF